MTNKKVVRGAGGRFEPAPVVDEEVQQPTTVTGVSLVQQLIDQSARLNAASVDLSETFYSLGLINSNTIATELHAEDRSDSEGETAEYSAMHMVSLQQDLAGNIKADPLNSTAGRVLGYHAVPAMALAVFVSSQLSQHAPGVAFDAVINSRAYENNERFQSIQGMINELLDSLEQIEADVFGVSDDSEVYPRTDTSDSTSLIGDLRSSLASLNTAVNAVTELDSRLNSSLR